MSVRIQRGRQCRRCGADDWYKNTKKPKPGYRCAPCTRISNTEWEDPAWRKNYDLKALYGITLDQWHDMLVAQQGRCAMCALPMRFPQVDHSHETGEVRGLLCKPCNTSIGHLERPDWLSQALTYLKRDA